MGEEQRPGVGQGPTKRRYTVADAAEILGLSAEAVRSRIKRHTLESVKEGSTVYVLLDADQTTPGHDQTAAQTTIQTGDWTADYIASLEEQITYLRRQLEEEREARTEERRRHDTIVAQLASRIPQLEPPREERESPTEHAEPSGRAETPQEAGRGSERPWWRRWFGG